MGPMPDQSTSLSPAALRDIIAHIDNCLTIFAKPHPSKLHAMELQAKLMLIALRSQLVERLMNHPDNDD